MKDTPGWASPGSAPSEGQEPGTSGPAEPADRPDGAQPDDQPGAAPQSPGTKWSAQQPPPGQWSAPTGPQSPGQTPPPPAPYPGWGTRPPGAPGNAPHGGHGGAPTGPGGYGAPGGWGAGWGGPPPAVKPGVIPLRPLGVGEILDGAVSTLRAHWRTVLGISLTVAVVIQVIVALLQGLVLDDTTASTAVLTDPDATVDEQTRAMGDLMRNSGVVFLVALVGTIAATALLTTVTSRAVLGKSVTTGEAWRDARPQVPRLFGLIFLMLLIAAGVGVAGVLPGYLVSSAGADAEGDALSALGALAGIVVAVWLLIRLSLASPALMLEKQGIKKALSRSAKLVKGSWWRIFGIQVLSLIIANIVAMVVALPFALLGAGLSDGGLSAFAEGRTSSGWTYLIISGIGSVIGSMITFPITAGVGVLLYIDQRIRREALDIDLARAAGIKGYATPTSGTTPGS
ncbi:glycerophosphoryl diester phosphodiesterase membrane domain-containing protein [Streptomyces sp. A012304]|uniref:glycerophosphoryl diester phosphodiesterase membrane domain-containing protein n=1 Tax=Streptomyces sp. A012304 TaxID=375446 RepID=UPI00222E5B2C|nr:glycerophosphoryl diester phosphodiesterase membrane domain-containing protein [Streptomyces sp. A012304]GKQ36706.1 membrane protein [Streptomyces sp. A012304]